MPDFRRVVTPRLTLTAVSMAELDAYAALHSDPETYRHAPESRHPDRAHSESVLEGLVNDWQQVGLCYWTVRANSDGRYLGIGGVRLIEDPPPGADAEALWNVYYRFLPAEWGNRYAAEVVRAAAPCAETVRPGSVLQATMRLANPASRAVAVGLGMTDCGLQLDAYGAEQHVFQRLAADFGPQV